MSIILRVIPIKFETLKPPTAHVLKDPGVSSRDSSGLNSAPRCDTCPDL
jgi:hypothetical protein